MSRSLTAAATDCSYHSTKQTTTISSNTQSPIHLNSRFIPSPGPTRPHPIVQNIFLAVVVD